MSVDYCIVHFFRVERLFLVVLLRGIPDSYVAWDTTRRVLIGGQESTNPQHEEGYILHAKTWVTESTVFEQPGIKCTSEVTLSWGE